MWDRLPMAAAITALVAATLAERVSVRAAAGCCLCWLCSGPDRAVLELERATRWVGI